VYEIFQSSSYKPVTYYILAVFGYPQRIEAGSMGFHSLGSVKSIQKPKGNCQPMPSGGMTAGRGP